MLEPLHQPDKHEQARHEQQHYDQPKRLANLGVTNNKSRQIVCRIVR